MPHTNTRRNNARRPSPLLTLVGLLGLIAVAAGSLSFIQPAARAASAFTVNSTGDGADSNTADNLCDDGAGRCTLRAAIEQANAAPGPDTITFQIGSGPQTIKPARSLPTATAPVVIDGATQPGYAGAPIIVLDGSASSVSGLVLTGGDSTVRALVIHSFRGAGIFISGGNGGNRVEGCYIGTDLTGRFNRGNDGEGIYLSSSNNHIGGTTPAARNVISGNRSWGIDFDLPCCIDPSPIANNVIQGNYVGLSAAGDAAIPNGGGVRLKPADRSEIFRDNLVGGTAPGAGNVISGNFGNGLEIGGGFQNSNIVQGNFIGTDATGSFAVPNFHGVLIEGADNIIGGTTPAARNVISGNRGHGVVFEGLTVIVRGNIIGANAALTEPIPNSLSGVSIVIGSSSVVGGTGEGEANVIAFNGGNGIEHPRAGTEHRLRGNSIFSNGGDTRTDIRPEDKSAGLGIDLGIAGVTPNDAGDGDFGANRLQNFPVITSVTPGASSFNVKGSLNGGASITYDLDFHANGVCDPSGFGEGARRVGSAKVTTDSGGNAAFDLTFGVPLAANQVLTATATDPTGNTSEFSQCAPAGAAAVGSINFEQPQVSVNEAGGLATFVLTRTGGSAGAVTVNYSVRDLTASAGSDFAATSGTITFADGETSKSFTVPVLEDGLDEMTFETAVVALGTTGDLDALGHRSTATLSITDNDPALDLSVGDVSAAEGRFGTTAFEFPVTLSARSGRDGVTLTYETEFGTAAGDGNDFSSAASTLTIPEGQKSGKITVFVRGDAHIEPDETFFVNITSVTSATVVDGRGQGTILNDDIAKTFTVNSTGDGSDGDLNDGVCVTAAGDCTLRAAIEQSYATSGTDIINFSVTGTINLTGPLPDIIENLTISGPGPSLLTVRRDTGGDYRIFNIIGIFEGSLRDLNLAVSISGLTLANGRTPAGVSGEFGRDAESGGGLLNGGTLTMTDVVFTGNSTGAGGAGTRFNGGSGGRGGAIFNFGALTMTNVTLTGNSTGAGGAGVGGGFGGHGGAISNMGTLTMIGCVVRGNSTGRGGEGIAPGTSGGIGGYGAGIDGAFMPVMTMTDCLVSENTAGAGGDSNGSDGRGGGGGGGAGIIDSSGTMTLTRVIVSNNKAGPGGRAPLGIPGGPGPGGGIYFDDGLSTFGPTSGTITDSTVSGNAGSTGSGILNGGILRVTNTTVSGNRLMGSGGAISGALTLTNCTVTANEGPGFIVSQGSAVVRNTIIAGNGGGTGPDVSGAFNSHGHNLVGNVGGASGFTAAGDQAGTSAVPINARLGPLADNGGPTLTHALLAGSPALDAGSNALATDDAGTQLATDQRGAGFPRFADSADADTTATVDIGAFEAHPSVEDVTDKSAAPNTQISFSFGIGDAAAGISSVTASSNNQSLAPDANLSVSGAGSSRTLQITPAPNQTGSAVITLTVTAASGRASIDTFVLTVSSSFNNAPSFNKGADQTVAEDSGPQTVANWPTAVSPGPPDDAGQSLAFVVTGNTNPGLFSAAPAVSPSGSLTYTPAADATGVATIALVLMDDGGTANGGQNTSAPQTFRISVTPVNDAPTAADDSRATDEDAPLNIAAGGLTGNDSAGPANESGQTLAVISVGQPSHGTAALNADGSVTYTPAADYSGPDSFTYTVRDDGTTGAAGDPKTATATVNVTVNPVNDVPAATVPGAQSVDENSPLVFSSDGGNRISISDAEQNPVAVMLTASSGSVTLAATAGLTFTAGVGTDDTAVIFSGTLTAVNAALDGLIFKPTAGFSGAAWLTVFANEQADPGVGGAASTVDITVNDGGTLQFSSAAYSINEASGQATLTVVRAGGTAGAAAVNFATGGGTATSGSDYTSASGTLTFAAGETSKTFTVAVADDGADEADETVNVTLSAVTGSGAFGAPSTAVLTLTNDDAPSLSFKDGGYTVNEGDLRALVTVTRGGDTSLAASVKFLTVDDPAEVPCDPAARRPDGTAFPQGAAYARCDYATTVETLSFAPGQAEKQIAIPVIDDAHPDGVETVQLRLAEVRGAAAGAIQTVTLTITDNDAAGQPNPAAGTPFFVRQHYLDFLSREPEAAEPWSNVLARCPDVNNTDPFSPSALCDRLLVSQSFFLSPEFQLKGGFAYFFYRVAFNRRPEYSEIIPDMRSLTGATPQEVFDRRAAYAADITGRPEFTGLYGALTNRQYVDALLGRYNLQQITTENPQDFEGTAQVTLTGQQLSDALDNNSLTRGQVLRAVVQSSEVDAAEFHGAFVAMQYYGYLRRTPEQSGYDDWLRVIRQDPQNVRLMVNGFMNSQEYKLRFGQP